MTSKNNREPLPYSGNCESLLSHPWIQILVTVPNRSNRSKIVNFLACVNLKFVKWPKKTIGHLFYYFKLCTSFQKPSVNSNWGYSPEMQNFGQNWRFFLSRVKFDRDDREKQKDTSSIRLQAFAPFWNHRWIWTGNYVLEIPELGAKFVLISVTLTFDHLHRHHFCQW